MHSEDSIGTCRHGIDMLMDGVKCHAGAGVAASSGADLKVVVPIAAAVALMLYLADKRRKAQRLAQSDTVALTHGLVADNETARFPIGVFEQIPERSTVSNMLRDRSRPQERFGFLITFPANDDDFTRTVGAHRSAARRPHLTLLRRGALGRFSRRGEVEVGDEDFAKRWIVKCERAEYAMQILTPSVRAWLMTMENTVSTPVLEARAGDVVAIIDGDRVDRIPELIELAQMFSDHLVRAESA